LYQEDEHNPNLKQSAAIQIPHDIDNEKVANLTMALLSGKFVHCLRSLSVAQSPENFQCPESIIIYVKRCNGAINSPHQFQIDPKYNKPRDKFCCET
jgi:hypothetical protein